MAVYKRDMVDINLETGNIHRSFLKHSIGYKDAAADHFGIRVFRNGEPVNLTGVSVQGIFMPPQGSPIAITSGNIVSENEAEVVLPQACYNYDGQFTLAIKLVDSTNEVTGTVRIVDGMVDNTHASGTVAPTSAVPTYQEVLSAYEQAIAAINKTVRFDATQSLTDTQKATARSNISAPSVAEMNTALGNEATARQNADALKVNISDMNTALGNEATARQNADALKVNISDIENDLTGTTAGKVLDARQGKVLDDKVSDVKSAFNDAPVDAHETNFAELTSVELNPLTSLKEIDKNYKQYNGKYINSSNKFTENNAYTTFIFRLPFYGFKITCAATKIYICNKVPEGTVGETIDIYDTITTSGSQTTFVEYTMNYSKGAIVVLVWNTQGIDPTKVRILTKSNIPFTEPRLKMLPFQDEFNFYSKKDTSVNTGDANSALGIITYTGKVLATNSGNVSDNSSYNTYSFQVPVDSLTITCPNGYRCTKSYYKPGDLNSNSNLIELVYETDSGRVETFTAKYKEWVSISVNMNRYPGGLNLKTNLSHPFELPGLKLAFGQSQAFYRFEQLTYASGSQRRLWIYFRSGNKVVQWLLWNSRPNTGVVDTWQIGTVSGFDFNGTELSNEVELVKNGEFEIAFKEHGAADYCGGVNHGDEITNTFKLFLDGKLISDLSTLDGNFHVFNRIDAFEIATINRCDTAGTESPVPLITHQKRWVFENGKVTVNETIKTLVDLSVDGMLCCMFPALRSAYTYGIRQGGVEIEDLTTSTYEKIVTTENEISYLMYGANCTARINSKLCDHTPTGQMWINPTSVLNKLYYGFWGATDTAHPVQIPSGTIAWWENEYDVAYN